MRLVDTNLGIIDDIDSNEEVTLGEYLTLLLKTLLEEQEGFSGKRPFGNSGWMTDISIGLVKGGAVDGRVKYDEDGFVDDATYSREEVMEVLMKALKEMYTPA